MTNVLLVVDLIDDGGDLERVLEDAKFTVRSVRDVGSAIAISEQVHVDLAVVTLDPAASDSHTAADIARLREAMDTRLLVLTPDPAAHAKATILDFGADDCISLPAVPREFLARVRALLRRPATLTQYTLVDSMAHVEVDVGGRVVRSDGGSVDLTRLEFDVLVHFMRRPGKVIRRDELLRDVWHSSDDFQGPAITTEYIRRIRRKLPRLNLQAIRGVGYRYEPLHSEGDT